MKQPLQLEFLGMEASAALEAAVRRKVEKLEHFSPQIMACRVEIEQAQKHKHQGRPFAVRVHVRLPDHELTVDRAQDEDAYVALRDAFDHMKRQIEDRVRKTRGDVKEHEQPLHGEVVRLVDEEHYGFIRTPAGDEYYFDRENVAHPRFEQLEVGTAVQFLPEVGAQGRQAKRVSAGKHAFG
jgi:ribosomal subunit interface protein